MGSHEKNVSAPLCGLLENSSTVYIIPPPTRPSIKGAPWRWVAGTLPPPERVPGSSRAGASGSGPCCCPPLGPLPGTTGGSTRDLWSKEVYKCIYIYSGGCIRRCGWKKQYSETVSGGVIPTRTKMSAPLCVLIFIHQRSLYSRPESGTVVVF